MKLLVATRSSDKAAEIRRILGRLSDVDVVDLKGARVEPSQEEEEIEAFDTFEENAEAKARHFFRRTGLATVADDSGLVVDALDGRPGVRSKRFAPGSEDLPEARRNEANNEHLLTLLGDLDLADRTARYVCVAALVTGAGAARLFRGEAEGLILGRPRGTDGFGYDPLFFDRALGKTFAEISRSEKNRRSHRGKAFEALRRHLLDRGEGQESPWTAGSGEGAP